MKNGGKGKEILTLTFVRASYSSEWQSEELFFDFWDFVFDFFVDIVFYLVELF